MAVPGISNASFPSNFYSITAAQLLTEPEPQYLHARIMLAALGTQLNTPMSVGITGREIGGQGAAYTSAEKDRLELAENVVVNGLFAANINFNGKPGDVVRLNRPRYTDSTYTLASRRLAPGQVISTTPITVEGDQVLVQLHRYAGPYNTAIQPIGIEAYDAQRGIHNAVSIAGTHLKRDFHKWLDTVAVGLLDDFATAIYPEGMTAIADATADGQFPLDYETLARASKAADEANLPTFSNGKRLLFVTPTGCKQLADDPQFARYAAFFSNRNPLQTDMFFAELPDLYIAKSNTLSKTTNGGVASSTGRIHYGQLVAPGALGVGMGRAPQVRTSTDDNYGETVRCIWLADLAFALLDSRFGFSVRYTKDA